MNENALIELIKGGVDIVSSPVKAIAGAIITTLFLRSDTTTSEFEKIKAAKFDTVLETLLDNRRISYLELHKCKNFLKIAKIADEYYSTNHTNADEKGKEYDFDWFIRFYEYASNISEDTFQKIWASVLAREVCNPGTTSIFLLHSLSMMNKYQAQFFGNISRFVLNDIDYNPILLLFVSTNRIAYEKSGITVDKLKELERLGLIDCDWNSEFVFLKKKTFRSGNHNITVLGDTNNEGKIKAGNVKFTNEGKLLYASIDDSYKQPNSGILEFTISRFKARNCKVYDNEKEIL